MVDMDPNITPDRAITARAATQFGLVTVAQARELGLSTDQIKHRVRSGRWQRLHRGVYRVAGSPPSWRQRALAACLALPPDGTTSHLTASALVRLGEPAPPTPHLTVGPTRSARLAGAVVHRSPLDPQDVTRVDGIPTTTAGRTLVDCAGMLGPVRLQRMVDEAMHRRLVDPAQIDAIWDRVRQGPGRGGEGRLRKALAPWVGPIRPGSPAEARLRQQLRQWGFPEPDLQVIVRSASGEVVARIDLGWPLLRVGIEYDSQRWHGPTRWADDLARQDHLERLGWRILRADLVDLHPGAYRLRDEIKEAIAAASASVLPPRSE